jgi:predicted transcriptional regulator
MRRSSLDIIIDILEVTKEAVHKTGIVYKANLNFKLADKYLDLLQKYDLIENKSDKYVATEKGKGFLEKAKELIQHLEEPSRA